MNPYNEDAALGTMREMADQIVALTAERDALAARFDSEGVSLDMIAANLEWQRRTDAISREAGGLRRRAEAAEESLRVLGEAVKRVRAFIDRDEVVIADEATLSELSELDHELQRLGAYGSNDSSTRVITFRHVGKVPPRRVDYDEPEGDGDE